MKFLGLIYFGTSLCFFFTKAEAQVNLYPKHFSQVLLARQLLNPALANMEQATNVTCGNRFYTGPFSKINNFYFIGNLNLNRKDTARYASSVGMKFANEREGEFVERSRYYASYSIRRRISNTYWLGLGIDLGRAGYLFKGTDVSTAGSDSNWDGDMGVVLHNSSFCLAGSLNQLFNTVVQPKNLAFRWGRFYTLYAEKKFNIGTSQLSIYGQNKFLPQQIDVFDVGANFTMARIFCAGSNVWVGRSVSFLVGLKDVSLDNHHFSLYMSYNTPASNQASTNIQSFEMSLYYQFK